MGIVRGVRCLGVCGGCVLLCLLLYQYYATVNSSWRVSSAPRNANTERHVRPSLSISDTEWLEPRELNNSSTQALRYDRRQSFGYGKRKAKTIIRPLTHIKASSPLNLPGNKSHLGTAVHGEAVMRSLNISSPIKPDLASCETNSDCARFQKTLQNWPPDKPKAALYYLTQASRLSILNKSLLSVDLYMNRYFHYPIIIFHEAEFRSSIPQVRNLTSSDVYFQEVHFEIPKFLQEPVRENISCLSHIGYRHMCRFHIKGVWEEPIMRGLDYYWRFDDDSLLLRPVEYDVFKFMRRKQFEYGYIWKHWDNLDCTKGLWNAAAKYVKENVIHAHFFNENDWPMPRLYYNNFEISSTRLWTSPEYQAFANYLDRLGGIYYHRWGDAPVKGIAVAIWLHQNQTHLFSDVGYQHTSFISP